MIQFFDKRLSAKMLVLLVVIMAVSFAALGFTIISRQDALLTKLGEGIQTKLEQTGKEADASFAGLEQRVSEQMIQMGSTAASKLTNATTEALSAEEEKLRAGMEKLLTGSAEAVAAVLSGVAQESIMAKDYDQLANFSRAVSQTKDIIFVFFMDQDDKLLPGYVNIVDDLVLSYLEKAEEQNSDLEFDSDEEEHLHQLDVVLSASRNDASVMIYEKVVEYYSLPIGKIVIGVSKVSVVEEIAALTTRFNQLKQDNEEVARTVIGQESSMLTGNMKDELNNVAEKSEAAAKETALIVSDSAEAVKSGVTWGVLVVGLICCLGVIAAVAMMLRVMVIGPINKITEDLRDTAEGEGDLTKRINSSRVDEIGLLARWFDTFVAKLNDIIVDIGANSETVTSSSFEVLSVSEQMLDESSDLKSKASAVNQASEEMNMSMASVAAACEQASTNISFVAEAASTMREALDGVVTECDRAKGVSHSATDQVKATTDKVSQLGDAAREISKVSEVITEIADQTNLLALNATIEAARAGDAGKGFAVVASEIKDLANQTQQATFQIKQRISGIQQSTEDTVEEVGKIAGVIEDVDSIMSSIAESMGEQSVQAGEVARNIEQASLGIGEVNQNVAQSSQVSATIAADIQDVNEVANAMSARSGDMRRSAEGLSELSSELKGMISVFKVSVADNKKVANGVSGGEVGELFPWNSRLVTGIDKVDDQHRELVRLINELHRAMTMKAGAAEAGRILDELANYTVYHFNFEEELFDRHGYPASEGHKIKHRDLVAKVNEFREEFKKGRAGLSMDLMNFLVDWLRTHIRQTDMAYVPFLKDKIS